MWLFCQQCQSSTYHVDDTHQGGQTIICDECGERYQEWEEDRLLNRVETLICLHCNKVGEVVESLPLSNKRLVTLSCGHCCTFDLPKTKDHQEWERNPSDQSKETAMTLFNREDHREAQKHCLTCGSPIWNSLQGAWGEVCWECKCEFGIHNAKDAEELKELITTGQLTISKQGKGDKKAAVGFRNRATKRPDPKVDQTLVAAGVRAMTDYLVAPVTTYEKPVSYVTAKNGLFEVRHSDLCTIITHPKEVMGVSEEMKEGWHLNLPKLPFEMLLQTISFFRAVCKKMNGPSEALVQIWWDREATRHHLHIPEQQVSGGGVHHQSTFDQGGEGRWFHVADIHSHGGMGAFWSGTDNADEARVTTERLFGVIGKVEQPFPEWAWRMRTRDGFINLNVVDLFEMPSAVHSFTIDSKTLFQQLSGKDTFKDGMVSLWCPVDPFKSIEIPAEWLDQVKGYSHGGYAGGGWMGTVRYPQGIKGFIYIQGAEYEVTDQVVRATGHKLVRKGMGKGA